MGKDTPDYSIPQSSNLMGDVLPQLGKMSARTCTCTLAAGAKSTISTKNNSPDMLIRVCGIRFYCVDDVRYSAYLYNTYYGLGFYMVNGFYEIWYPASVNWVLAQDDYVAANIVNLDASSHQFLMITTSMDYSKPLGWVHKPDAYFTVDDSTPAVNQVVAFTEDCGYTPTRWFWMFGDGHVSYEQNPTHAYTSPGTYYASLLASNAGGDDLVTATITVT
jgi:PKD repeat protein